MPAKNQFAVDLYKDKVQEFWKQALMLEVLQDAYDRSGNKSYYEYVVKLSDSILERYGDNWLDKPASNYDRLTDDPLWMTLAFLRSYEITNNEKCLQAARNTFDSIWNKYYDQELGQAEPPTTRGSRLGSQMGGSIDPLIEIPPKA